MLWKDFLCHLISGCYFRFGKGDRNVLAVVSFEKQTDISPVGRGWQITTRIWFRRGMTYMWFSLEGPSLFIASATAVGWLSRVWGTGRGASSVRPDTYAVLTRPHGRVPKPALCCGGLCVRAGLRARFAYAYLRVCLWPDSSAVFIEQGVCQSPVCVSHWILSEYIVHWSNESGGGWWRHQDSESNELCTANGFSGGVSIQLKLDLGFSCSTLKNTNKQTNKQEVDY